MTLHRLPRRKSSKSIISQTIFKLIEEKINYLKKAMKIRAMLCDEDKSPEEVLSGLKESALFGYWKASW